MDERYARDIARAGLRREKLTAAAAAAVRLGQPNISELFRITKLLNNSDPLVREGAINTLSGIGGSNVISYITRCLNDCDSRVRTAACSALGRLRAHSAKSQLYDVLADRKTNVSCAAALALADMGDKRGLPYMVKLVRLKGSHQIEALRAMNRLTGQKFPLTRSGLTEAQRWIKLREKHLMKF